MITHFDVEVNQTVPGGKQPVKIFNGRPKGEEAPEDCFGRPPGIVCHYENVIVVKVPSNRHLSLAVSCFPDNDHYVRMNRTRADSRRFEWGFLLNLRLRKLSEFVANATPNRDILYME